MNLFGARKPGQNSSTITRRYLPEINAFVDVATCGKTENLPIEDIGPSSFQVRRPANCSVGADAMFNYRNGIGIFRFRAGCTSIEDRLATYALPAKITVIEKFGDKRASFRLQLALPVLWRYAPDGVGYGEFMAGGTANISCTGAALVVPRELRPGTQIEVKLNLGVGSPFALIGTLVRATEKLPGGKYIAGLAFKFIPPAQANTIDKFIATRKQGLRNRGFAD